MPPRVAQVRGVNDRGPADWYNDLPPITRLLLTVYVATGFISYFGILPLQYMYHDWRFIFKLPLPEVWRLLTCWTFIGGPSIKFLFRLVWLVQYGASYEKAKFQHNTADGITAVGLGMAACLLLDLLLPRWFHRYFHGTSLIFMWVYLWSKQNPQAQVNFFGVVPLQGFYLPFVFVLIEMLEPAGDPMAGVLGILMGHVYYFLTEVYPVASGRHVIRTPQWLSRLVYRAGLGRVPIQAVNPVHPGNAGFRAFAGRGRRLVD